MVLRFAQEDSLIFGITVKTSSPAVGAAETAALLSVIKYSENAYLFLLSHTF